MDFISELVRHGYFSMSGGLIYVDKSIRIGGSVSQSQLNTGDHVSQTATWSSADTDKFNELIAAINNHSEISESDKSDAIETLEDLKGKKESGALRPTLLQKMWETIPPIVRTLTVAGEVFAILHGA